MASSDCGRHRKNGDSPIYSIALSVLQVAFYLFSMFVGFA